MHRLPEIVATHELNGCFAHFVSRALPETAVEIVTWRLIATAAIPATGFTIEQADEANVRPEPSSRAIYLPEQRDHHKVPVFDRYSLEVGTTIAGPAILQEPESTIVVARPATISVLEDQTLSIEIP